MSLTNMQYDEIIRQYNRIQFENKRKQKERIELINEKLPRISEIAGEISSLSLKATKLMLHGHDNDAAMANFKEQKELLIKERKALLKENGFPADYLELHYDCPDCKDTGFIYALDDSVPKAKCHCFKQAEIAMLYEDSNIKDILKTENFDNFKLDIYDDTTKNELSGKTSRQNVADILNICHDFTDNFSKEDRKYKNLIILGETGVGKTFLTNCIAKELIENSISVVYLSAINLFEILANAQFSKDDIDSKNKAEQIFDCDLLIIDDLGTELLNSYTGTALFNVINERILSKKSCIISTNLKLQDITERYSERLTSRLSKDYKFIRIFGDDLRRKNYK